MSRANRSSRAPRFGSLAEEKAREIYDLRVPVDGRRPWYDARDRRGRPVEIKAAMQQRSNGGPGKFRVFAEPHDQLRARDGRYVFIVYQPVGRGIRVVDSSTTAARDLRIEFTTTSDHASPNRDRQAKVPISAVV